MIGVCKICNRDRKLVNSHIIPRSLYRGILAAANAPSLYSTDPKAFPKKSRIGVYAQFLCMECETKFNHWDKYAAQFFLQDVPAAPAVVYADDLVFAVESLGLIGQNSGVLGKKIVEFDYGMLKLFLLSVLWRAALCSHTFFRNVTLVAHERPILDMVLNSGAGDPDLYACFLISFDDPEASKVAFCPHRLKFRGVNGYRFFMAGCSVFIKVDSRPMPVPDASNILRPNSPLYVMHRKWANSSERRKVLDIAANATEGGRSS